MTPTRTSRGAAIVILADRDKVEMEDEIRAGSGQTGRTRIVCRTGSPMDIDDLAHREPARRRARSSCSRPTRDDPDADVIKTILAITNDPHRRVEPYHVVAEIRERTNLEVARMVGRDEVELDPRRRRSSRASPRRPAADRACRSSTPELLDFAGDEIYLTEQPALEGRTFGDTLAAFADASVIGLLPAGGTPLLNPPMDTVIGAG